MTIDSRIIVVFLFAMAGTQQSYAQQSTSQEVREVIISERIHQYCDARDMSAPPHNNSIEGQSTVAYLECKLAILNARLDMRKWMREPGRLANNDELATDQINTARDKGERWAIVYRGCTAALWNGPHTYPEVWSCIQRQFSE